MSDPACRIYSDVVASRPSSPLAKDRMDPVTGAIEPSTGVESLEKIEKINRLSTSTNASDSELSEEPEDNPDMAWQTVRRRRVCSLDSAGLAC